MHRKNEKRLRELGVNTLPYPPSAGREGERACEYENERWQGQQRSHAVLSESLTRLWGTLRNKRTGTGPGRQERKKTNAPKKGIHESWPKSEAGVRQDSKEGTGCQPLLSSTTAGLPPPPQSSPGLGLNEGPRPKDGDQRVQSVGATGEQGEAQAHSCCPPSLQPRSCREKRQHQPSRGSPLLAPLLIFHWGGNLTHQLS